MAKKENTESVEFINPFTPGVNYDQFTKELNGKTATEYLKGRLNPENPEEEAKQIAWLEGDLIHYNNNKNS